MSLSVNEVTLLGHLGKNPEFVDEHQQVAIFSLATNESYQDKRGEWQTSTEWHRIKVRGPLAERAVRSLKKGSRAYIKGKVSSYENKSGVRKWEIIAFKCGGLDKTQAHFDDSSELLPPEQPQANTYPKSPWGK